MVCNERDWKENKENYIASQSPYGAKWFATYRKGRKAAGKKLWSQSPYGAKWFATLAENGGPDFLLPKPVAIPLRG